MAPRLRDYATSRRDPIRIPPRPLNCRGEPDTLRGSGGLPPSRPSRSTALDEKASALA